MKRAFVLVMLARCWRFCFFLEISYLETSLRKCKTAPLPLPKHEISFQQ